jgi:multidrug resistance protein
VSGRVFLKRVGILMAIVFVDMLGFLIVLPLLPFYAEDLGASESLVGVLISAFAFAQLVTSPFWGKLSDRYGRRPMILLGLVMSALSYALFGLAETVLVLLVSRLVQGAGAGTTGVVQAYVSDAVPPSGRTQALGWVTVATSAGVMIGPAVGSLATGLGRSAPGFVAAGLCLLNFVFAWFLLPESASSDEETGDEPAGEVSRETRRDAEAVPEAVTEDAADTTAPPAIEPRTLRRAVFQVLFHPRSSLATLIWIYALGMMAFMALNGVVALYLERVFDFTAASIGWFYVYVGAVSTLMRGVVLGPVVRRLGEVRTLRLGVVSIALGLAAVPLAFNLVSLALVVLLVPVGTALLFPATTSLVSQASHRDEVGQSLGVQQAFGGVSRMVGPLWATAAFQYLSIQAPFWLASGLMLVVLGITLGVSRRDAAEGSRARESSEPPIEAETPAAEGM